MRICVYIKTTLVATKKHSLKNCMNSLTYFFIYASLFRNIINLLVRKSTVLGAASIRACDDSHIIRAYMDVYLHELTTLRMRTQLA